MKEVLFLVILSLFGGQGSARLDKIALNDNESAKEYRIRRIRTHKGYHAIYAVRNDSTFKIISRRNNEEVCKGQIIKVGGKYRLELGVIFPIDSLFGIPVAPNHGILYTFGAYDEVVTLEQKAHYRVYDAKGLIGLNLNRERIIDETGAPFMEVNEEYSMYSEYIVSYIKEDGTQTPAILYDIVLPQSLVDLCLYYAGWPKFHEKIRHAVVFDANNTIVRSSLVFLNQRAYLRHDPSFDELLTEIAKEVAPHVAYDNRGASDYEYRILLFSCRYKPSYDTLPR